MRRQRSLNLLKNCHFYTWDRKMIPSIPHKKTLNGFHRRNEKDTKNSSVISRFQRGTGVMYFLTQPRQSFPSLLAQLSNNKRKVQEN